MPTFQERVESTCPTATLEDVALVRITLKLIRISIHTADLPCFVFVQKGSDCTDCGPRILGQHSVFSIEPRPPPPPSAPPAPFPPPAPNLYIRGLSNAELSTGATTGEAFGYTHYDLTKAPFSDANFHWRHTTDGVYNVDGFYDVCRGDMTSIWFSVPIFEMCRDICTSYYGTTCNYWDVTDS